MKVLDTYTHHTARRSDETVAGRIIRKKTVFYHLIDDGFVLCTSCRIHKNNEIYKTMVNDAKLRDTRTHNNIGRAAVRYNYYYHKMLRETVVRRKDQ